MKAGIEKAIEQILAVRRGVPRDRSVLVGISGIDGSGKGFVTARLETALQEQGLRVANINVDGWLNLPAIRFSAKSPAAHFYYHALRFEEMFSELVTPLRERRSVRVETDHADETATEFRKRLHEFSDIDVILLEGIFLLKSEWANQYDISFWIDCSFQTALKRAVARCQEDLSPAETVRAYETIFFPAQEIHFVRDQPQRAATAILDNDPSAEED